MLSMTCQHGVHIYIYIYTDLRKGSEDEGRRVRWVTSTGCFCSGLRRSTGTRPKGTAPGRAWSKPSGSSALMPLQQRWCTAVVVTGGVARHGHITAADRCPRTWRTRSSRRSHLVTGELERADVCATAVVGMRARAVNGKEKLNAYAAHGRLLLAARNRLNGLYMYGRCVRAAGWGEEEEGWPGKRVWRLARSEERPGCARSQSEVDFGIISPTRQWGPSSAVPLEHARVRYYRYHTTIVIGTANAMFLKTYGP